MSSSLKEQGVGRPGQAREMRKLGMRSRKAISSSGGPVKVLTFYLEIWEGSDGFELTYLVKREVLVAKLRIGKDIV